jgi:hypothetical protein
MHARKARKVIERNYHADVAGEQGFKRRIYLERAEVPQVRHQPDHILSRDRRPLAMFRDKPRALGNTRGNVADGLAQGQHRSLGDQAREEQHRVDPHRAGRISLLEQLHTPREQLIEPNLPFAKRRCNRTVDVLLFGSLLMLQCPPPQRAEYDALNPWRQRRCERAGLRIRILHDLPEERHHDWGCALEGMF